MSAQLPIIKARHYTATKGRDIDLVVWHSMEAPEKGSTAEDVARYFALGSKQSSAHTCFDDNSGVRCVADKDVAYAAPGANHNGLHIELAGYARQNANDWADAFSSAMLKRASEWVRDAWLNVYGIPAKWLTDAELRAGARGMVTHAQVSRVFKKSDHSDPGEAFPKMTVLAHILSAQTPSEVATMGYSAVIPKHAKPVESGPFAGRYPFAAKLDGDTIAGFNGLRFVGGTDAFGLSIVKLPAGHGELLDIDEPDSADRIVACCKDGGTFGYRYA